MGLETYLPLGCQIPRLLALAISSPLKPIAQLALAAAAAAVCLRRCSSPQLLLVVNLLLITFAIATPSTATSELVIEVAGSGLDCRMATSRAQWAPGAEKTLVDMLIEYSNARWRGQNGWTIEGWNKITKEFNENFLGANFTRSQIKEHEEELKTSYKLIKELRNKSGISWDKSRFQILTSDEVWKGLIQANLKVKK